MTRRGEVHEALEQYDQAVADDRRVTELRPDDPGAWNRLGNALLRLGELQAELAQHEDAQASYAQAIAVYEEALRRTPDLVMAHNNKGNALRSLGDLQEELSHPNEARTSYQQAVAAYSQAIALAPEAAYLRRNRVEALVLLGRLPEAEADVDWALEHEPENMYTQGRLGQLRLAQGRFAEAEAAFRQAAAQDEQEWLDDVALALLGQGREEEALVTLDCWLPQATRWQRREALRWLDVVLRHAPDAPGVEVCRRRLAGG